MIKTLSKWMIGTLLLIFTAVPVLGARHITADTIWTAAMSPYLIEEDLIVNAGVVLTVEPGVEVRFSKVNITEGMTNRAELIVFGRILALGISDHPIRFTANSKSAEMGAWGGIYVQTSGSRFEHVQIDHATTGVVLNATADLNWMQVENNLEAGILVSKTGSLNLCLSEISYNQVGLLLEGSGKLEGNRFSSNSYGVLAREVGETLISNNSFESNTYGVYLEQCEQGSYIEKSLISGNDYGIFVDGGVSPQVNYNDLYNNYLYDFYHLTKTNANAHFNWWGTTDQTMIEQFIYDGRDIAGPERYGYVDYAGYLNLSALAPTVLSLTANPSALQKGVMTVTVIFSKEMDTLIKPNITYGLVDPYTAYTINPVNGSWQSLSKYQFSINIEPTMPEGLYRWKISGAKSLDGQLLKPNIAYSFVIDRTPPIIMTEANSLSFSPNGDGKADQLAGMLYFSEPARLTYSVYNNGQLINGPFVDQVYKKEGCLVWDGKNTTGSLAPEGSYEIQVYVQDQAGNRNILPYIVTAVLDLTPPELTLVPFIGVQTADALIQGKVEDQGQSLTEILYRKQGEKAWQSLWQFQGNKNGLLYTWNLAELGDGVYELWVVTIDEAENQMTQVITVEIDVNPPEVKITSPVADAHLALEGIVMGSARDYHLSSWRLELETEGMWNLLAQGTQSVNGELYQLNLQPFTDGLYRLRLMADDSTGKTTEQVCNFYIDNHTPPEVITLSVMPQNFSPNGDGLSDSVHFLLNFSELSHWQIDIKGTSGGVFRTLKGAGQIAEVYWDGRRDDGTLLADGTYSYILSYVDQVGHAGIDKSGQLTVDTVPPALIVQTLPTVTNLSTLTVMGQAFEFAQVLVNGEKAPTDNGNFSVDVDLVQGINFLQIVAEDVALNREVQSFAILCDTLVPEINLYPGKTVTNQEIVIIEGDIVEANLALAEVELINAIGNKKMVLTLEGSHFCLEEKLAVGVNQLIFSAIDLAGNQSEKLIMVNYLPAIPEIYLVDPINPYRATRDTQIILKVLEGSVPLDPASIRVDLDGLVQNFEWNALTKEIKLHISGLEEGRHILFAQAFNVQGEAGGELIVELIVDLTDPELEINFPADDEVVDGAEGVVVVLGRVGDVHLDRLVFYLQPKNGVKKLLLTKDLRGMTDLAGELADFTIRELPNGEYYLEIVLYDRAGRAMSVQKKLHVKNTGQLSGRVQGDLGEIVDQVLFLVAGTNLVAELPFDPLTGEFIAQVEVGNYDLVLAPWGYEPVVYRGLKILTGQNISGLEIHFSVAAKLNLKAGKQLFSIPYNLQKVPEGAAGKLYTIRGYDSQDYYLIKDWTLMEPGRGYWLASDNGMSLLMKGEVMSRREYRLPLQEGWNLIATPYNYPYPLQGLMFRFGGQDYTFAAGREMGKVDAGIWKYQGWYQLTGCLEPWQGYWIYVNSAGEVIFRPEFAEFPYKEKVMTLKVPDQVQAPEWKVQIKASLGDAHDLENYFGVVRRASAHLDPGLDLREPPGCTPYILAYFLTGREEKLSASYQGPLTGSADIKRWIMVVESDKSGMVRLNWNLEREAILRLELSDEVTGETLDMFSQSSYEFYQQSGSMRKFTITAAKSNFAIKKVYNFPNPFSVTGQGSSQGTKIRYLLTDNATVEVEVFDIMGRRVKKLLVAQAGRPGGLTGWNELVWDGKNGRGEPVAGGLYVLKIKALYGKRYYTQTWRMAIINGR